MRLVQRLGAWRQALAQESTRRQRGQIMLLFAVAFVAIAGAVGMSADMGMWFVEQQHLQTAVDSAAVAGARYYIVYAGQGAATQLSQATTQVQTYLTQYGYPSGSLTSLNVTSPQTRQIQVQATKARPTMLIKLIGISQLTARANSTANAEIKADIYAAVDITGSMNATDITNTKAAVNSFISNLGLDPTDANGPKLAIGEFVGERCQRVNPSLTSTSPLWTVALRNSDGTGGMDPTQNNWIKTTNWLATSGSNTWCDPNNAPALYSGTTYSPPAFNNAPPTQSPSPNPFFPGANTIYQLGQVTSSAQTAANGIRNDPTFSSYTGFGPGPAPPGTTLAPYWGASDISATSHTAGLVTAAAELNSNRTRFSQGQTNFRRVLILQTDGIVCPTEVPFSQTQSQNRAKGVANQLKNTPNAFSGVEIFTIMFYDFSNPVETCPNNTVSDVAGIHNPPPACGPSTTTLPPAAQRGATDNYLIALSSSAVDGSGNPTNCDHYLPADKSSGSSLSNAYIEILKRLAVGRLVN